jgi:hypothetical protein
MGMMKYVESLLGKNEQILWRARQHWIVLSANFAINLFIFLVIWAIFFAAGSLGRAGWVTFCATIAASR